MKNTAFPKRFAGIMILCLGFWAPSHGLESTWCNGAPSKIWNGRKYVAAYPNGQQAEVWNGSRYIFIDQHGGTITDCGSQGEISCPAQRINFRDAKLGKWSMALKITGAALSDFRYESNLGKDIWVYLSGGPFEGSSTFSIDSVTCDGPM